MTKKGSIICGILVILAFIIAACGGGSGRSVDSKQLDKSKNAAQERDSEKVQEETKKYNLTTCSARAVCAIGYGDCKHLAPATEPGVCLKEPILKCICPQKTICVLDTPIRLDPEQFKPSEYYAHCKSPEEIK